MTVEHEGTDDQWNRIDTPERDPHTHEKKVCNLGGILYQRGNLIFLVNGVGTTEWGSHLKKDKIRPLLNTVYDNKPKFCLLVGISSTFGLDFLSLPVLL